MVDALQYVPCVHACANRVCGGADIDGDGGASATTIKPGDPLSSPSVAAS